MSSKNEDACSAKYASGSSSKSSESDLASTDDFNGDAKATVAKLTINNTLKTAIVEC